MKRFYSLLCILIFYSINSNAQFTPTDSLEWAFKNVASDTTRLSILFKEKPNNHIAQPDKGIALYQKGYELAQRLDNKLVMAKMLHNIGVIYASGKFDEGTAFQYYQKALKISEEINDYKGCEYSYYNIGLVYDHQGFRDKMYESFLKSFENSEKAPIPARNPFYALISVYMADKKMDKALAIAKRAVVMMEKPSVSASDKMFAYHGMLTVLKTMPNQEKSVDFYTQKVTSILENEQMVGFSSELAMVMEICLRVKRYDLSVKYANYILSQKGDSKSNMTSHSYAHYILAEVYEIQKKYPLSIEHYKKYMDITTKVNLQTATEDAGRKVIKAEAERDLLLKQNEVDKQKWFAISGFCMAVALSLGLIFVYYFYKREQKTKQELAQLNATKDKLFALISHDLMSPLANFKALLMLPAWGLMSQAEFEVIVKDLSIKAHNLYSTCENMLHWAITQMEGMKAKVEKINVAAVINEQISLLEPIAKGKQIEVQQLIPDDITIEVDKNHFALIVRNLLQNALKFTHSGGQISFNASNTDPKDSFGKGGIKLMIQDNGIGMSSEIMSQLFQIDKNTNRAGTSKETGTGLGLILTKELVELNRGQIDVTSTVGRGTAFTLAFS